ncbi:MAG: FtsX-like permease family protein, partial [Pseudomonadota bacterium]
MSAQSRSGGASVEALSVGASRFDFRLVRRLALRDLRGSLRGFSVFVTCLALGVAIITAVGIVADSLTAGFTGEGRRLLGGDVALTRVHSKATAEERVAFARYGRVSEIATLRTMADRARTESEPSQAGPGRSASETVDDIPRVMVEVKAVDGAYPLVGELRGALREENAGRAADEAAALDERLQNGNVAVVAPLLLERLGLSIGDEIALGAASVRIIDTLTLEPDGLTGRAAFGPRVLVSLDTLEASGLVGPGSLVRWRYRIDVTRQDDTGAAASHVATVNEITRAFAPLGYGVRDRRDPAPGITQGISRFRQFLTLVGLTAMFVGGIGVANAVAAFLDGRAATIATLRAIGADSRTVNAIYLLEIMIVAALGVALGLLLGIGLPYLAWLIWGGAITLPIVFTVSGFTVALAAGYGLLVALVFVLWPLGRIEHMRPALLFREQVAGALPRPSLRFALATGLALALLVALTVFASGNPTIALWFFVGVAVMFGIFLGLAEAIRWLALKIPRVGGVASAMALRNLAGPGALTRPIVLSLGTGLT